MTSSAVTSLLASLVLASLGSSRNLESCKAQRDETHEINAVQLFQVHKANQSNNGKFEFQHGQHHGTGTSIAAENRKIYTYWDYGNDPRPIVALNIQTWLKHAPPDTELVLVNESNFLSLIPDAPDEIFRLPYAASKSDVVRAAVLYHHGGLYLDTDFIVMKPLSTIFAKLEEGWDVVSYSDDPSAVTGKCNSDHFSSNFMAARKGNVFSGTWWENIKAKLTRTCDAGAFDQEQVCCHEAFSERYLCHIPWGHLEWLKDPGSDADFVNWDSKPTWKSKNAAAGSGHGADAVLAAIESGNAKPKPLPQNVRIFCLQGRESFSPLLNGNIYWQKWDAKVHATSTDVAKDSNDQYELDWNCREVGNGDLSCDRGVNGVIPNFFGRIAHHLYFALKAADKPTRDETLASGWLAAELLRRSLGKSL